MFRFAALLALLPTVAHAGVMFNLDFNTDGVLPSSQGLTFVGTGVATELGVMSVSGGVLTIDTLQYGSDVAAFYRISPGFDHTLDAELEFRARVLDQNNNRGFFTAFSSASEFGSVVMNENSWAILNTSAGASLTSEFHVFNLFSAGNSNAYTLTIDGIVAATGSLPLGSNPSTVFFGDGTPTGGNFLAEVDYIRYNNNTAVSAVPEPSGFALLAMGMVGFMGYCRFRKPKITFA